MWFCAWQMWNINSKLEKNEGVTNNPPSRIISSIVISTRNTIMPPDSLLQLWFCFFFQNTFYGVFDLFTPHKVKQYQCSLQAHAVCLIIYKLTAPHFLKLLFPASVKIVSQTTEKCFNDFMSSRKVIILQLSFISWAW